MGGSCILGALFSVSQMFTRKSMLSITNMLFLTSDHTFVERWKICSICHLVCECHQKNNEYQIVKVTEENIRNIASWSSLSWTRISWT